MLLLARFHDNRRGFLRIFCREFSCLENGTTIFAYNSGNDDWFSKPFHRLKFYIRHRKIASKHPVTFRTRRYSQCRVTRLCCDIAVFWNWVSLSEANCNVRQSHSIFAENIRIARLATLTALGENIYRGDSEKNNRHDSGQKDVATKCLRTRSTFGSDGISRRLGMESSLAFLKYSISCKKIIIGVCGSVHLRYILITAGAGSDEMRPVAAEQYG